MTENGLVDITDQAPRVDSSSQSTAYVIPDSMDALWHPVTGEYIDSKSKFRRITKNSGCEELGNDRPAVEKEIDTPGRKEAILDAWEYSEAQRNK